MCSEMNNGNVHKDKATTIEQKKLQLFLYIFIFVICIKIVQLENKYMSCLPEEIKSVSVFLFWMRDCGGSLLLG